MKKSHKLISIIASFVMLLGVFTPLFVSAQESTTQTTSVTVTKVVSESTLSEATHDGKPKDLSSFGAGATYLNGAEFEISEISAEEYAAWVATKAEPQGLNNTQTYVTAGQGSFNVDLADGYYWITEVPGTPGVTEYIATDFALGLPLIDEESGARLDSVHLYPKNQTTTPTVDKTVTDLTAKDDGFAIGETITYWVKATIPAGELNKFQFVDTLSEGLTFADPLNAAAYIAEETTDTATVLAGTPVAVTPSINGQTATFDLAGGLATLKANAGKTVYLKYDAVINDQAAIATNLPNDVKLVYNREGSNEIDKEEKPTDMPKVYTGGKKFIKQDPVKKEKLDGAEFKIKNSKGEYMIQDPATLKITWGTEEEATVIKSANGGQFEVKGLDFGATAQTLADASMSYYLVETKAPEGYVIPETLRNGLEFTVNENSYKENATELTANSLDGTLVNNNTQPNIPNTGGIGSAIFILIGLLVMGGAVYGYKKFA